MNISSANQLAGNNSRKATNQNIQAYVRQRPANARERNLCSLDVVEVVSPREIIARHSVESKVTRKFTFDRTFGANSRQVDVYTVVVAPLIDEVLAGYNCTVFAYGQTGTGKTHTMIGTSTPDLSTSWQDDNDVGIIPRALSHLFDELRMMGVDYSMRISFLELYNEELCDLLSTDDSTRIRIFDDATKKGSVIVHGLEEVSVHNKDDVYKLLAKGQERRKTATTLMNAQSSRSHTVFSILVHIRETGLDGEEMLKIGKLNLVDLAGSENATKAGTERGPRIREAVNINQSLLTLGRVITALVERTPHIPYRESKLTRLLQESLGGRTKTSIIATISPGHKDIEETLSTLQYADRAKSIQNKPEINQKLTKTVMIKEYSDEIDKLKRELLATRNKNGIYLSEEHFNEINTRIDSQTRELNEKFLLVKALKNEMQSKERLFVEISDSLVKKTTELESTKKLLQKTKGDLVHTEKVLNSTKTLYHVKKVLLNAHMKTEEVLTDQANEILKVADVATSDTKELHHAIERRKNVDRKIEQTCAQFAVQMQDHFAIYEDRLSQLQTQHQHKIDFINKELSESVKLQNDYHVSVASQTAAMLKMLEESETKTVSLEEKMLKELKGVTDEHKHLLQTLFSEQKLRHDAHNNEINKIVQLLIENNKNQSDVVSTLLDTTKHAFEQITNEWQIFTKDLKTQYANDIARIQENINSNDEFGNMIENSYTNFEQQKIVIDEFVQKMQEFRHQEISQLDAKKKLSASLHKRYISMQDTLKSRADNTNAFFEKQCAENKSYRTEFENQLKQVESHIECGNIEYSTMANKTTTFYEQNTAELNNFIHTENENCTKMGELMEAQKSMRIDIRSKWRELQTATIEQFKTSVNEYLQKFKNGLTRIVSYAMDLQGSISNFANDQRNHIKNSVEEVEKLRKVELKTYAPTGATPSKRDFAYPRALTSTEPHDQIVKRLRQEYDLSNLDVTTTIEEEDAVLGEDSIISLKDNSNISIPLNSTPLLKQDDVQKQQIEYSIDDKENFSGQL